MRVKEKSTSVILVRHGKTDFPLDRIYCDDAEDPALNDVGLQQARGAAESLRQEDVAALYASPACRTMATAKAIADVHGLPIEQREQLRERRFGIWEGLYFHEISEGYPEQHSQWKVDNAGFKPEGGESIYDLLERMSGVFAEIQEKYIGKTVVVVTHVGPIRAAIADAIGLPIKDYRRLSIDYASISRVDYGRTQNNLIYLNRDAVL